MFTNFLLKSCNNVFVVSVYTSRLWVSSVFVLMTFYLGVIWNISRLLLHNPSYIDVLFYFKIIQLTSIKLLALVGIDIQLPGLKRIPSKYTVLACRRSGNIVRYYTLQVVIHNEKHISSYFVLLFVSTVLIKLSKICSIVCSYI